jgi:hypothetical protein
MSSGRPCALLHEDERIAHQYATQLMMFRRIDSPLFATAMQAFGLKGPADIAHLAGAYQTICGLVNSFAVPSP